MSECNSARSHGVMWIDEVWGSFCPICKCSEQAAEIKRLKVIEEAAQVVMVRRKAMNRIFRQEELHEDYIALAKALENDNA
jgi:hypothetical protein